MTNGADNDTPWPDDEVTKPERLSAAGLAFLKRHEGLKLHMYDDVAGHCTIGYGHLVHRGPTGSQPGLEAPFLHGITEPDAAALLARDAAGACSAVASLVPRALKTWEFDALADFTYNVGIRAFTTSTLLRRVNALVPAAAITEAFLMWNKPPQILGRRKAQALLYNTGNYGW